MTSTYPPETTNGVVTSWIPLTTGWTDISGCSSRYIVFKYETSTSIQIISNKSIITDFRTEIISAFVAYYSLWGTLINIFEQCLLSEVMTWRSQLSYDSGTWLELNRLPKISLLPLTCPDAWSTVATFIRLSISTQVMRCPS